VPGDEAQPEIQGGAPQLRTGPRHAAPRKSLLTRVHVPAGKAIALAAMPTAVLMGMGLTPRLAQAAEPTAPFSGDHCVSQSDTPTPGASSSATPSTGPSPSASPTHGSPAKPTPTHSTAPGGGTKAASPSASPSKSASAKSSDPSDPLGLGGVLGGLLGGLTGHSGSGGSTPTPTASPTPSATPTPSHSAAGGTGKGKGGLGATVGGVTKTVTGAVKGVTQGVAKAADPSSSVTPGMPYPCPTYNAKALADAGLEQTPSLLPNEPWVLKSDMLTLTGLKYDGIVKVETENGTVKDVLKFTATGVDIHNLHQLVQGPDSTVQNVQGGPGTTSTIRNGTVTMYTEELKGNLLGLIPIDFTPQSPPPLTTPSIFFTNVTVTQAGQFGGTLTVPGMHGYATPGSLF
jgi:hypothetical protein